MCVLMYVCACVRFESVCVCERVCVFVEEATKKDVKQRESARRLSRRLWMHSALDTLRYLFTRQGQRGRLCESASKRGRG